MLSGEIKFPKNSPYREDYKKVVSAEKFVDKEGKTQLKWIWNKENIKKEVSVNPFMKMTRLSLEGTHDKQTLLDEFLDKSDDWRLGILYMIYEYMMVVIEKSEKEDLNELRVKVALTTAVNKRNPKIVESMIKWAKIHELTASGGF